MIFQNLHMHSNWDDGRSTVEEMIRASIAAGLSSVGFSLHSPLPFDNAWACPAQSVDGYIEDVRAMQKRYAGQIDVYLGVEWDVMSDVDLSPFDYAIGSVHQLPVPGFPSVDESAEVTARFLVEHFGGDADAAAEMYFSEVARVAREPRAQIVGHFDLLTKFDERQCFFDPDSPRYRAAARRAMEQLVAAGKIFEVNTGAISRGYRTSPYPSRELLTMLREMGGRVTVSADAHHTSGVACAFEQAEALVRACGFEEIWVLKGNGFVPVGFG